MRLGLYIGLCSKLPILIAVMFIWCISLQKFTMSLIHPKCTTPPSAQALLDI